MQHSITLTRTIGTALLALIAASEPSCSVAADGRIVIRVVDGDDQLMPARAWVDVAGQRLFKPLAPRTATSYARDRSFSCDGSFTMVARAGKATVHVERGKEFLPVELEIDVPPGETVEKTIQLKRWINMPERGWYSADLHMHLGADDPRVLRQLALADDVHLVPSFTYWLRGRERAWNAQWPDDSFDKPIVIDDRHLVTRNNIEIERINHNAVAGGTVGATFLFNLNVPVTSSRYGEHFPTDAGLCRAAREHSADAVFDSDKPSWAETVVGAALGGLDTIQVCHNHYHRSNTLTGGWGMIGPLEADESNDAAGDGLFHRTNALYYRFLNCGFRLGVSGGSAIGVMPVPAGYSRVYARIDGPFNAQRMWAAIKAGKTFATSGPMLSLTVDGKEVGATLSLDSGRARPLRVRAAVQAIETLESLEIIHNGRVVASRDLAGEASDAVLNTNLEETMTPNRSGWIASRALFRAPDGRLRQAHTSPVYLVLDDKPTASAADARYMLRWIDRLVEVAESEPGRFPDIEARDTVLTAYAEARIRYEQIIDLAQEHWGD